jgi:predicted dehydrogenase
VSRYGGEGSYDSIESMLPNENLDGVILCTWPNLHAAQMRTCLSRDIKNILCEKALVTSTAEARSARDLARQFHANVIEASRHRHHQATRKLERLLETEALGPIDCVRAAFHNYEPEDVAEPSKVSNWRNRAEFGGGVPCDYVRARYSAFADRLGDPRLGDHCSHSPKA